MRKYPYCDATGLISKKLVKRIRKELLKYKKEVDILKLQDYALMQTPYGLNKLLTNSASAGEIGKIGLTNDATDTVGETVHPLGDHSEDIARALTSLPYNVIPSVTVSKQTVMSSDYKNFKAHKVIMSGINYNMVLTGNPGSGKSTLARLIHQFFFAYGLIKRDVFVERNAGDLKAPCIF